MGKKDPSEAHTRRNLPRWDQKKRKVAKGKDAMKGHLALVFAFVEFGIGLICFDWV
jgi:hypothetical protein